LVNEKLREQALKYREISEKRADAARHAHAANAQQKHQSSSSSSSANLNTTTPLPPACAGAKAPAENSTLVAMAGAMFEVFPGRRRRVFTQREMSSMVGLNSQSVLERIRAKGFRARIVPDSEM
jgi:hypothetical protein